MSPPTVADRLIRPSAARGMLTVERRRRIAGMVAAQGSLRVRQLSRKFGVSEVTIRTDLKAMAHDGLLIRSHGGAVARRDTPLSTAYDVRAREHLEAKRRIARAAVAMLQPGETVILDSGTTLMELARAIPSDLPLTVITNALNVAACLAAAPQRHVIVTGGSLSPEIIATVGPLAEECLGKLVADKLFLSAQAIDPKLGVTDVSPEVARIKRAMIGSARQVILLADSSKWRQTSTVRVVPLRTVHEFVTDHDFPAADARRLARQGTRVRRV